MPDFLISFEFHQTSRASTLDSTYLVVLKQSASDGFRLAQNAQHPVPAPHSLTLAHLPEHLLNAEHNAHDLCAPHLHLVPSELHILQLLPPFLHLLHTRLPAKPLHELGETWNSLLEHLIIHIRHDALDVVRLGPAELVGAKTDKRVVSVHEFQRESLVERVPSSVGEGREQLASSREVGERLGPLRSLKREFGSDGQVVDRDLGEGPLVDRPLTGQLGHEGVQGSRGFESRAEPRDLLLPGRARGVGLGSERFELVGVREGSLSREEEQLEVATG